MATVAAVADHARTSWFVQRGRFILTTGRMPWTRETRVHVDRFGWASVTVLGRFICLSWR